MTLLDEAFAAGLAVAIKGDKLMVRGPRRAEAVARKLLANKAEVMAVLTCPRWPITVSTVAANSSAAADWCEFYAERAAFRQYEAGYGREAAEHLAFGEVVEAWCRYHPQPYDRAVCAGCRRPLAAEVLDLPDGTRVHWERIGSSHAS